MRRAARFLISTIGFAVLILSKPAAQAGGVPAAGGAALGKGGAELAQGPYEPVADWPIHDWAKPGYIWGSQSGIFPETPNKIFLASRGELKIPTTPPPNFNGVWAALGLGGATT